ncbi:unnamed protein product [Lactuca saligna]|uniref:Bifunctional inhibitor/plant lipid transfer protein/seed storage helical domain-containing protein n=1 Tax=Lactuca saligna TaxID=75948 RepID=A0AA35V163_LACSI|nr:unnamed protein product [Lactuca saligna]
MDDYKINLLDDEDVASNRRNHRNFGMVEGGWKNEVATAVTCMVTELAPCADAFSSSSPPSQQCCTKLKEQRPCLCQYMKNPSLKSYVVSPNAQKVATSCGLPTPKC